LTLSFGSGVIPAARNGNQEEMRKMKFRPAPPERNLVERSEILDAVGMARVLRRIAYEIVERNGSDAYFVGIRTGGALLAERMVKLLVEGGEKKPAMGAIDIALYRDDVFLGLPKPEIGATDLKQSLEDCTVVLIDDVLFTGRTVRAAMDVLADYGRPRAVQLAVLVDRGRRELPIQPDYVGVRLQTTAEQSVRVMFSERGETDRVVLRERSAP
jgi:pyrimidine operon attenuation protein/uracil phosphoribosyltransferase